MSVDGFPAVAKRDYERTWMAFLGWAAAASLDPRALSFPTTLEAYSFLGEEEECREPQTDPHRTLVCLSTLDVKNPFAKIEPALRSRRSVDCYSPT